MRASNIVVIIVCIIAVLTWCAIRYMQDVKERDKKRKEIADEFHAILAHYLAECNPRIYVDIRDDRLGNCPRAWIQAYGKNYCTTAESDTQSMIDKAKKAADFFGKKKLMKWIPND